MGRAAEVPIEDHTHPGWYGAVPCPPGFVVDWAWLYAHVQLYAATNVTDVPLVLRAGRAVLVYASWVRRLTPGRAFGSLGAKLRPTHAIDLSGAFLPGLAMPVWMLLDEREPHDTIAAPTTTRLCRGVTGEPELPRDPREGIVWRAVCAGWDAPGDHGAVRTRDVPTERWIDEAQS